MGIVNVIIIGRHKNSVPRLNLVQSEKLAATTAKHFLLREINNTQLRHNALVLERVYAHFSDAIPSRW